MLQKLYTLRAYASRKQGESGRVSPLETSNTDDWTTAKHYAKNLANDHGACVTVNNTTGERHWIERQPWK